MSEQRCFNLSYGIFNYQWGKIGQNSLVYQLGSQTSQNLDQSKPYAEIWMGTHPNKPSSVQENGSLKTIKLSDLIQKNPKLYLGKEIANRFNLESQLPFLFKILSINQALSIQAHPSKSYAKQLFKEDPEHYKDDNYKPEMVIALTEFEALNRFCLQKDIIENINNFKEILQIIGQDSFEQFKKEYQEQSHQALLKQMIQKIVNADQQQLDKTIQQILQRLESKQNLSTRERLVQRLHNWFPNDVGILVSLFLNYTVLQPGQSLVLNENQPHAYIYGDCIECMANSDNVVRLGLTPKFKDTVNLMNMLQFTMEEIKLNEKQLVSSKELQDRFQIYSYQGGYSEFKVQQVIVEKGQKTLKLNSQSPLIFIVISGKGTITDSENKNQSLSMGVSNYIIPNTDFILESNQEQLQIFMATIDDDNFQIKTE